MSRATARTALATWLAPPNVSGLNSVFTSFRTVIDGDAFTTGSGSSGGAVGIVFIPHKTEQRIAVGGALSGKKRIDYSTEVHVFGRWVSDGSFSAENAMDAFDIVIDGIETRIRSDRSLGGSVWAAGEDMSGDYGVPADLNGMHEIWGVVKFTLTEWVNG